MASPPVVTSLSNPLDVSWVSQFPRLGMTEAPGAKYSSLMAGTAERDLDLQRLQQHFKVTLLVTLQEEDEMKSISNSQIGIKAQEIGIKWVWVPVKDMSVPQDLVKYQECIDIVLAHIAENPNNRVVVHCMAGKGRTGTLVACTISKALKISGKDAIKCVRDARVGTIQNWTQEKFINKFTRF